MTAPGEAARLLAGISDDIAACRAWGHTWPSRLLRPGKPLPMGYLPRLADDGHIEVTEYCMNGCGKRRRFTLLPEGVYDWNSVRRYRNPRNWVVLHREDGITRRHLQAEVTRRNQDVIVAAAMKEAARERSRPGQARE